MEVGLTRLSTKGQIVIPQNIREAMKMTENEQFIMIQEGKEILIKPVKDALNIKYKKSKHAEDFIRAMKHDKILEDMEEGKELSAEDVL